MRGIDPALSSRGPGSASNSGESVVKKPLGHICIRLVSLVFAGFEPPLDFDDPAPPPNPNTMGKESALLQLTREERMLLMRFVCSFVWVDFKVRVEEREMVARLIRRLELDAAEEQETLEWLKTPPDPESIDPYDVPHAHRVLFLRAVETVVSVDREVTPEERESVILFAQLIR